ncbi:MAG: protein kinase, partial [Myxococcales bacterium]|nr:protein kinase [Myxococcales bacterium]
MADTFVASETLLRTLPVTVSSAGVEELGAGAQIGRYLVIRRLGAGAMGVVYAAYDPKLDRKVALKLLAELATEGTEDARQRLQREAQALAKLAHPNVVGVYDVDTHDRHLYVAMEFVAGRTLGAWMR